MTMTSTYVTYICILGFLVILNFPFGNSYGPCGRNPYDGYRFWKDCNLCVCSSSGVYSCTLKACVGSEKLTGKNKKSPSGGPPGKSSGKMTLHSKDICQSGHGGFWEDCNWCICIAPGDAECTLMACPPKKGPALAGKKIKPPSGGPPGKSTGKMTLHSKDICQSGHGGFWEDCNWCICIAPGDAECTLMACPPKKGPALAGKKIKPRPDGRPGKMKGKTTLHSKEYCKKGNETFRKGCNWCSCWAPGEAICNLIGCGRVSNFAFHIGEAETLAVGYDDKTRLGKNAVKVANEKRINKSTHTNSDNELNMHNKTLLSSGKKLGLKEMAMSCKKGDRFEHPLGYKYCDCIEDGVVICDQEP